MNTKEERLTVSLGARVGRETIQKVAQTLVVKRGPQPTKPTIWDLFTKAEREAAKVHVTTGYTGPTVRRRGSP